MKRILSYLFSLLASIPAVAQIELPCDWYWTCRGDQQYTTKDTVTVRIIGDVMLHTAQLDYARRSKAVVESADGSDGFDFHPFLDSLKADLSSADVSIANMEFALGGEPYSGYPAFSAPDSYAKYVRDMGVSVFLTANNHITDKGAKGVRRTFEVYDTLAGVYHVKTNPTMINVRGVRLALVNCTYGTNSGQAAKPGDGLYIPFISDKEYVLSSVRQARELGADFVIVLPHWGSEYVLRHNAEQEAFARELVRAGADVIVGAHPHCVQDWGYVEGVPVYYSMGNAVSNMSAPNTQLELMVTLRFVREDNRRIMLEPAHDWLWCSRPGFLNNGFCTIKIKDFEGRRHLWKRPSDYDKMIQTLHRVRGN